MKIAFRVDASSQIGTGHFMRCLTLADALKQHGSQIRFLSRHLPGYLRDLLAEKEHQFRPLSCSSNGTLTDDLAQSHWLGVSQSADAQDAIQALSDQAWDWLVVDHYALDVRWESALRRMANSIMVIDDIADRQHDSDILLDQNFYADMETRYVGKVPAHCRLLLSPRYALLREEFRHMREQIRPRTGLVKRILVFFGGVDADNYTARVIEALGNIGQYELYVDVVVGAQHPQRDQIESACAEHGFVCHVQTNRMAELMASADLAIGAGGSASWERCCLGLPALAFSTANNQRPLVDEAALRGLLYAPLVQFGVAPSCELHLKALLSNPHLLQLISRRGLQAVDGLGVQRVLRAMGCNSIAMREATQADSGNLFTWRNHCSIRAVSRNTDPIEESTHEAWLNTVLSDPDRVLLIGEYHGEAIGIVRFDMRDGEAEVSMYLVPDHQGEGFGSELLSAAEQWLAAHRSDVRSIKAEVLGSNHSSHRLFRAGRYQPLSALYSKKVHHHI